MTKLDNLKVEEVSFVDEGANPESKVVLFKRKSLGKVDNVDELTATLRQLTDKLSAQLAQAEEEKFKVIAERYEILGTDADKLAQMLFAASKNNPQLYDTAIKVLDSALQVVKRSGTFDEIGKRGNGFQSAQNNIQTYAAQIQKANPNLSWRHALDAAFLQHPELQ